MLHMSASRSPKLTVLCRGTKRAWFLLRRGQFHRHRVAPVRADLSTGVLTLRATPGEFASIDGRVQVTGHNQAAAGILTAEDPICERHVVVHPPAARAGLGGRLPPAGDDDTTAVPSRLVGELPTELSEAHITDGLRQMLVLQHAGHVEVFNYPD